MKKSYFHLVKIVFFIFLFSSLVSCGGKNKEKPINTSITASATTTTVDNAGGDITIVVNANAAWTATANNGAKVSPASGKSGTTNVVATIPANTSSSDKTYTITFTSGTTSTNTTITQKRSIIPAEVKISPDNLDIPYEVSEDSFEITCSGDWEMNKNNLPDWIDSFDKENGKGNATVKVKTKANSEKNSKTYILTVQSGTYSASINLKKAAAPNNAPSKPTIIEPKGNNIDLTPKFTWTKSTDPDGDEIQYTVMYSKDNTTWASLAATKDTTILSTETLETNTTYYYKVVVDDGYEGGKTESDVTSFTTVKGIYVEIKISPDKLDIPYQEYENSFEITCAGDWEINKDNLPDWIDSFDKENGRGNATVKVKTKTNTERQNKVYTLTVQSGTYSASITLNKAAGPNRAPSKPVVIAPLGLEEDSKPTFIWRASTDPDGDEIEYTVFYSTANSSYIKLGSTKDTTHITPATQELETNTRYYFYVRAMDGNGGSTNSNTHNFKTKAISAPISISPSLLVISHEASENSFEIKCKGDWEIKKNNLPDWIDSFDKVTGKGNTTVKVKTKANTERKAKSYDLIVQSGKYSAQLPLGKKGVPNNAPSKPTNLAPNGNNIGLQPEYSWTASTDADGDEIQYTIWYSKDNITWKSLGPTKDTKIKSTETLEEGTKYYYKVAADDGYEGGKTESDVITFTTGTTKSYYEDCEYQIYQTASAGAPHPVVLIFTGDGYTRDSYKYGGKFDTDVNSHIEALFSVEPYKTYRNYFTIYKIAAYSKEAGMSVENPAKTVDTRFKCTWKGGNSTNISHNFDSVIAVVKHIPGINSNSDVELYTTLSWAPVSIVINEDEYAGTCTMRYRGGVGFGVISVANTPAKATGWNDMALRTQVHEFGGHAFGLLADEYTYYDQQIPDSDKQNREMWKGFSKIGVYGNATFINDATKCEWAQFIGRQGYEGANIGLHEGALLYKKGVWRSEENSCMIDNILHFNTQSRWQIYRRIMITAYRDENRPNIVEFVDNDKVKVNPFKSKSPIKLPRQHTPPIMYYNDRLVK